MASYFPAGLSSKNPVKSLVNGEKSVAPFPNYEFFFINPKVSYYGLNSTEVVYHGSNYPLSTTALAPQPEHPNGSQCLLKPSFGLTTSSLMLTNGGSGHEIGDTYTIYNTLKNNRPAVLVVDEISANGAITKYHLIENGSGFDNEGISIIEDLVEAETLATFVFVPNKFLIAKINIEDIGSGYDFFDDQGLVKERKIILSSSGSGSGFLGYVSTEQTVVNNSLQFPTKTHTTSNSNIIASIQNDTEYEYSSSSSSNFSPSSTTESSSSSDSTSTSTSVSTSTVDCETDYSPYLFGTLLGGAGAAAGYGTMRYYLDKRKSSVVLLDDALEDINAIDTDLELWTPASDSKPIQNSMDDALYDVSDRIRSTVRRTIFGSTTVDRHFFDDLEDDMMALGMPQGSTTVELLQKPCTFSKPIKKIKIFNPLDVSSGSFLDEDTFERFLTFDPNLKPTWRTFNVPEFFDPSDTNMLEIDSLGMPFFVDEDARHLMDLAVSDIHLQNTLLSDTDAYFLLDPKLPSDIKRKIRTYNAYINHKVDQLVKVLKADRSFKLILDEAKTYMYHQHTSRIVRNAINKEREELLVRPTAYFKDRKHLNHIYYINQDLIDSSIPMPKSYYVRMYRVRQNLKTIPRVLDAIETRLIAKLAEIEDSYPRPTIIPRKPSVPPPSPKISTFMTVKNWLYSCKSAGSIKWTPWKNWKPPQGSAGKLNKLGRWLGWIGAGLTALAARDAIATSETTSEATLNLSEVAVQTTIVGSAGISIRDQMNQSLGELVEVEKINTGFNSEDSFLQSLISPSFYQLELFPIYVKYYIGKLTKEESIDQIRQIIKNAPAWETILNLNLEDYNHPDDFDPPNNGHQYFPYTREQALKAKEIISSLIDPESFDRTVADAMDEVEPIWGDWIYIGDKLFVDLPVYWRDIVIKRREQGRLSINEEVALTKLIVATEEGLRKQQEYYYDALSVSEEETNCTVLCPPTVEAGFQEENIQNEVHPRQPVLMLTLKPTQYNENGEPRVITIEELELALEKFATEHYSAGD